MATVNVQTKDRYTADSYIAALSRVDDAKWSYITGDQFNDIFCTDAPDAFLRQLLNNNPYRPPSRAEASLISLYGAGDRAGNPPVSSITVFINQLQGGNIPDQRELQILCAEAWEDTEWWHHLESDQRQGILAKVAYRFWLAHIGQLMLMIHIHQQFEQLGCRAFVSSYLDLMNNNDVNVIHEAGILYGIGYRITGNNTRIAERRRGLKKGRGIWYNIDVPSTIMSNTPSYLRDLRYAGNMILPAPWDIDHIKHDMIYDITAIERNQPLKPAYERQQFYVAVF